MKEGIVVGLQITQLSKDQDFSIKLNSHLDFIPEKVEAVSNEKGEKFHEDISQFEKG